MPARAPRPRPASPRRRRAARRARSAVIAPVSSREPAQATPNRAPSSSTKLTTPIGRAGVKPFRAQGIDAPRRQIPRRAARRTHRRRAPSRDGCRRRRLAPCSCPGRPTRPTGCRLRSTSTVKPARRGRRGEPLAQGEIGGRPGEPVVPAGGGPSDVEMSSHSESKCTPVSVIGLILLGGTRPSESSQRRSRSPGRPSSGRSAGLGRQRGSAAPNARRNGGRRRLRPAGAARGPRDQLGGERRCGRPSIAAPVCRTACGAKLACSSTPRESTALPHSTGVAAARSAASALAAVYSVIISPELPAGPPARNGVEPGQPRLHERARCRPCPVAPLRAAPAAARPARPPAGPGGSCRDERRRRPRPRPAGSRPRVQLDDQHARRAGRAHRPARRGRAPARAMPYGSCVRPLGSDDRSSSSRMRAATAPNPVRPAWLHRGRERLARAAQGRSSSAATTW